MSLLIGWFGGGYRSSGDGTKQEEQMHEAEGSDPGLNGKQMKQRLLQRRTVEDVLCWLPPSPLLLMHATALLLRLTLSGASPHKSLVPAMGDAYRDFIVNEPSS